MGCGSCGGGSCGCSRACCKKYYPNICSYCGNYQITLDVQYFHNSTQITGNPINLVVGTSYTINYIITNIGSASLYSTDVVLEDNIFNAPALSTRTLERNTPITISITYQPQATMSSTVHSVVARVYVDTVCKKKKKCGKCKKEKYERWITSSFLDNVAYVNS